ncbi:DinB family protein [Ichthyenterobacterium magnum]|uniref:DinB family protein n=1 Tax=Ichthyenterobacterium magnum TaxID=1230530 RepID=A0A420DM60_9FLAO|nr:DinB family protein [Ichthyenterobacterium magnum]RKE95290.1 DinB family protein [Ichthyenterobacterium magnum]
MTKDDLNNEEYNSYYQPYIDKTEALSLREGLKLKGDATIAFFESIPEDKFDYRYANDKWTIKEVLQHIIDTERVFTYRALCIARKDKTALPGYDQDEYADNSHANDRSVVSLMNEYKAVRLATLILFDSFSDEILLTVGNANSSKLSVRAIGFITIGHEIHHCKVIKERYL